MTLVMPVLANWVIGLLATLFVLVSLFLMLVVLIQRPRGGGLSGAFGGAGGSAQAAFGTKTGDVLTVVTVVSFVLFLLLAMGLTWAINPSEPEPPTIEAPVGHETDSTPSGEPTGALMPGQPVEQTEIPVQTPTVEQEAPAPESAEQAPAAPDAEPAAATEPNAEPDPAP